MSDKFQPYLWDYQRCQQRSLTAKSSAEGMRLDLFVSRYVPQYSRQDIQKLLKEKMITINGLVGKASRRVHTGDTVRIILPRQVPFQEIPSQCSLSILYEDEWLVAVNKPAEMIIHPVFGQLTGTLMNSLSHFYLDSGQACPKPVHRLDRGVSGIVLAAKGVICARILSHAFLQGTIRKTYCAILEGYLRPGLIEISEPVRVISRRGPSIYKPAQTEFQLLKRIADFSFVKVLPLTGRRHQIRYHAHCLGHPILGDTRYEARPTSLMDRPALHAAKICLQHPVLPEKMTITAPLPPDFRYALKMLQK
ncbi:RluA family pseudouridine synthase [bacterium]|nr:RluA family pseudouridine synthase [bacterium]